MGFHLHVQKKNERMDTFVFELINNLDKSVSVVLH